jgi:tetratricopeptide (TPR) repeat protein
MPPYAWTLCWPGLARLWLRGQWQGLGIALLFGSLLNGLIVTTFLWPRVIGSEAGSAVFNVLGWFVVVCFWGASFWTTWRFLPRWQPGAETRGDDALFLRAQTQYLQGHWYDAEQLLERLLRDAPRDADAHLLLAGLYRHTQRYEEARQRLALIEHLEHGARWLFEIDEERRRLAGLIGQGPHDAGESPHDDAASKAA